MRPRSAPASRRRGAYGHSKDGPPQSPHLLELPQEPARRGRHVDAVVRVRPRWPGRESANPSAYITSGCSIVPNPEARRQMLGARATSVAADRVYDEWTSTDEIYVGTVKPLITGVLCGEPGAVIAYGATGSGKTHTMLGAAEMPGSGSRTKSRGRSASPRRTTSAPAAGLIPMAVAELFFQIETAGEHREREFRIHVSYLEVYQERVYDLLDAGRADVAIRHTPSQGFYPEAKEVLCRSVQDVERLLRQAAARRRVAGTAANDRSNRSHCVLQIHVHSFGVANGQQELDHSIAEEDEAASYGHESDGVYSDEDDCTATLAFVDLAGSERVSRTSASGLRLQEARGINKSLLALSQLVKALERVGLDEDAGKFCSASHLPYRDAKLTQLLQPSLSGAGRTVIICCVCLADLYQEETARTLHFARSVRHIKLQLTPRREERQHESSPEVAPLLEEYSQLQRDHSRLVSEHEELEGEFRRMRTTSAAAEVRADETDVRLARLLKGLQRYVTGGGESSPTSVAPHGWDAFTESLMLSTSLGDEVSASQAEELVYERLCDMMDGTKGALAQRAAAEAKAKAKLELAELGLVRKAQNVSPTPRWVESRRPKELGDMSSTELERLLDEAIADAQSREGHDHGVTSTQLDQLQVARKDAMCQISLMLLRRMELENTGDDAGVTSAVKALTAGVKNEIEKIQIMVKEMSHTNAKQEKQRALEAKAKGAFVKDRETLIALGVRRTQGVLSAPEEKQLDGALDRISVVMKEEMSLLQKVLFLSELTAFDLVRLACKMTSVRVQKGENIVEEGEDGDAMYILKDGCLDVFISDCGEKVRSYTNGDCFGEIALITEENKRTATVRVTSDTALVLRLARADIDDDLLDAMRFKTTVDIGLKFAGDMEAQLEESKEECAMLRERISLLLESQATTSPQQDNDGDSSEEDAVVEAWRWAHVERAVTASPPVSSRSMRSRS